MAVVFLAARYFRCRRGQALVEFGLIIPWLILLVVGVMEFGLILHQYMLMTEAAREGARSAALGGDNAAVVSTVKAAIPSEGIDANRITVSITPAVRTAGNAVTVTVSYPLATLTQLMNPFISATMVQGSVTMRVE